MSDSVWVINASPLILLGKLNRLDLLERLNPALAIPMTVFQEISAGDDAAIPTTQQWATTHLVEEIALPASILHWDIGPGESQVLAHCLHQRYRYALMDDAEARAAAQAHGIPVIGTLGIILRAKQSGLITQAKPFIEQLLACGSYLSTDLIRAALAKVGESC